MDPRIQRLVTRYAFAKGDQFLGRGRGKDAPGDVLAGWALERSELDPTKAVALVRAMKIHPKQRRAALEHLAPLVRVVSLR